MSERKISIRKILCTVLAAASIMGMTVPAQAREMNTQQFCGFLQKNVNHALLNDTENYRFTDKDVIMLPQNYPAKKITNYTITIPGTGRKDLKWGSTITVTYKRKKIGIKIGYTSKGDDNTFVKGTRVKVRKNARSHKGTVKKYDSYFIGLPKLYISRMQNVDKDYINFGDIIRFPNGRTFIITDEYQTSHNGYPCGFEARPVKTTVKRVKSYYLTDKKLGEYSLTVPADRYTKTLKIGQTALIPVKDNNGSIMVADVTGVKKKGNNLTVNVLKKDLPSYLPETYFDNRLKEVSDVIAYDSPLSL